MSPQHSPIGNCSYCGSEIRSSHILIKYESDQGDGVWAECPNCAEVVDPE